MTMMMHNPPHVGEILRELYVEPMGLTVTELAEHLGITRQALSRLLNERTGISPDMAIRLSQAFQTSPEYWMNLQKQYDLAVALENYQLKIQPLDKAA